MQAALGAHPGAGVGCEAPVLRQAGHGQGNTDNAAEFARKLHSVQVNGDRFEHFLWRDDCERNPCSPQGGTWEFDSMGAGGILSLTYMHQLCILMHMRTTLNIDDGLLERARKLSRIKEKTALVRAGLEALIAVESAKRLAALGGAERQLRSVPRRRARGAS